MASNRYNLCVIGSGPGGYVCALRGAQLGLRVALVEKDNYLGGTCLNVGCIPSKALLHSTELLLELKQHGKSNGIVAKDISVDLPAMMKRKDGVVAKMNKGVAQLCKAREVDVFTGKGVLQGDGKIYIEGDDAKTIEAENIVLATGSVPVELPFLKYDGERVTHSDHGIAFKEIPEKLVVVGCGAIGLELGSVWARMGSDVTMVEFLPQIAPTFDEDIAKMAQRSFKKQGLKFELQTKVTGIQEKDGIHYLTAEKNNKELSFEADKVLVAVGRKPFTEGLGLDKAGVELDDKGRIVVDEELRTSARGIWAIGDVVSGPMLAHKAEEEGVAVAERAANGHGHVDYETIPNVIYTDPEIASAGITERQAKEKKIEYNVGKFPLQANGRAVATDAAEGVVKVLSDKESDRLIGIQIVAKGASELIANAVAHMTYGGSAEDLGRTIHAHPTLSESVKEAGLAASIGAIHAL